MYGCCCGTLGSVGIRGTCAVHGSLGSTDVFASPISRTALIVIGLLGLFVFQAEAREKYQ